MNKEVYFYKGWSFRRLEGVIQGFVNNTFLGSTTGTVAIVLIVKSEHKYYRAGNFITVGIDELHEL